MKKLICLVMACLLCVPCALAAEWGEGLSAAKPYQGVPEVDLSESMGYIVMYPDQRLPIEKFCDTLEIYLPREDIAAGEGTLTLYDDSGALEQISFADADKVEIRLLSESELRGLMWGGGTCVEIHLPVALDFGSHYYVLMEEGCFTAMDGALKSRVVTSNEAWQPTLDSDYGVGALTYTTPEGETTMTPKAGDTVTLNLRLGGDAATAVVYSGNDGVYFEPSEYSESGTITGKVTADDPAWGIVFMTADDQVLEALPLRMNG